MFSCANTEKSMSMNIKRSETLFFTLAIVIHHGSFIEITSKNVSINYTKIHQPLDPEAKQPTNSITNAYIGSEHTKLIRTYSRQF